MSSNFANLNNATSAQLIPPPQLPTFPVAASFIPIRLFPVLPPPVYVLPPTLAPPPVLIALTESVSTQVQNALPKTVPTDVQNDGSQINTPFVPQTAGFVINRVFPTLHLPVVDPTLTPQNQSLATLNQTNVTFLPFPNNNNVTLDPFVRPLFGFPGFCSIEAKSSCSNQTLRYCDSCDMAMANLFIALITLLGFLIIAGNLFIIWCTLKKKNGFTGSYGKIKASLAVADLLTGLQIFCVTMYNLSWTLNSTSTQLLQASDALESSWQAYLGGMFFLLGITASMYNLIYLGMQRLYAIRWPIRYKNQSSTSIYIGLSVVWFFSFLIPIIPTWFPEKFAFVYSHTIFLFNLTITRPEFISDLLIMVVFVFVVPYVIMTAVTIATGVVVARYVIGRSRRLQQRDGLSKQEIGIFATVAVMQLGFTITLIPVLVVVLLANTGHLSEDRFSKPYLAGFYLSLTNSLVNVLVYSAMDSKFRKAVSEALSICSYCRGGRKMSVSVSSSNTPRKRAVTKTFQLSTIESSKSHSNGSVSDAIH